MWSFVNKFAAPKYGYFLMQLLQPWLGALCLLLFVLGAWLGLVVAPADYQQGDSYRILFIHVPAAVLSLLVYLVMTIMVVIHRVWKVKLADVVAKVSAPLGAMFTLVTLLTGSLWGRPTWGTYWIWDARLTSELILLFIYLGIIAFRSAIPDRCQAANACGLLTLVGVVNLPIVHYSVVWWNTLHQGATLLKFAKPNLAPSMLLPLLLMLFAYLAFYFYLLAIRVRCEICQRESGARWLQESIG